ncbi:MAG: hypothetical protein J6W14_01065 [Clostridia bacterium]|nr:hypothetical protein [Clostridia bacterium]
MRTIRIADRTLTETGKNTGVALSFKERIEIARHLDNLHADIIELPPIENTRTDTLLVRTVAAFVKHSCLSMPVGMTEETVEEAWQCVRGAAHPRLRVVLPLSPVQMEYVCHKKAPKMIELITQLVTKAVSLSPDVEFCAADATRAEPQVLSAALTAAVEAGATTVTVYDNAATMMPDELSAFLTDLRTNTPALEKVSLGICCENKYGMALVATVSAIKAGAQEVKTAVGDALSPSLDGFAAILRDCGDREGICASLKFTEMRRITKQIEWIVDQRGEGTSAGRASSEADVAEQEIALTSDASQESVSAVVAQLGYDLSDEDGMKVYEEFRRLSEKKKVTSKDLDAIVANVALQVPPTYRLIEYVTNSGNAITATAHIKMEKNGEMLEGVSLGDGPIDAAFRAIEQIVGRHFELDDFQIQSVTEGREAMGSALVRLRNNGKLYSGNGISTDIIGASIRAYLSALNKITYEEA